MTMFYNLWSRQLETHDDFDDDPVDVKRSALEQNNGHVTSLRSSKISQLVTGQSNKPKV